MDEDDDITFKTTITISRPDGMITDILEMPESGPYGVIGFIATHVAPVLNREEHASIKIDIETKNG